MGASRSRQVKHQLTEANEAVANVAECAAVPIASSTEEPRKDVPVTEVDEGAYQQALARCTELRKTRQDLLQIKREVAATIARFAPAFEDSDGSESSDSDLEDGGNVDQCGEEYKGRSRSSQEKAVMDPPTYEDLLAQQEELEDEVEMLQQALGTAASMIACVAERSQELSEHLEDVESQAQLPPQMPGRITPNTIYITSDTRSADAASEKVHDKERSCHKKSKPEELKLPTLCFLTAPGSAGSQASSSTATPRSEKSSESRMASARDEICWCEA